MAKLYKDKHTGKTLYPVCGFEKNQHKLYNAYDRVMIRLYDGEDVEDERERIERALDVFNSHVVQGLVYATYEDSVIIKDIIAAYDVRGDMTGNWRAEV